LKLSISPKLLYPPLKNKQVNNMPKNLNLNDDFSESEGCDVQEDRLSDVQEEGSIPF
jgi:hypothetical protein